MKRLFLMLMCISYFSCFAQKNEKLSGKFEYNKILNEHLNFNEEEGKEFKKMIESLDIALIDEYFKLIFAGVTYSIGDIVDLDNIMEIQDKNWQKADSLLSTDSLLSKMDTRMIALLYTEYKLHKMGFRDRDYYAISQDTLSPDGTINVFLTNEQYKKFQKNIDSRIKIKVQFIAEIKWTKFRVYLLKE